MSFMKTRVMALLMSALLFGCGQSIHAAENWDMAVAYPPGNYQTKNAEQFAAEVAKVTNGQVNIKVQAGGALGLKGPEMLGAIRDGLVPIGTMLLNQQVGVEPLFGVASLPYLVSTPAEMRTITELSRPTYEKIAAKHNQKLLYIIPWPGQNIFAKPEIRQPGDFHALKIRTVDRNGSDFFRELGASPAQMPWGEVVPSLATGVINSVTTSSSSGVDGQFWDFMAYCYIVNWQSNFDMVTVNLDQWGKLTPAQQKSIEDIAKKLEPEFWKTAEEEDVSKLKLLSDKGIKLVEVDAKIRDFMTEKATPTWEAFMAKVPVAREIIEKYRATTKK
jgi:TRAP-type transport system periplasmic protein